MESVGFFWTVLSWFPEIIELQGELGPTKWEHFYLQGFLYDIMFLKFHNSF